MIFECYRVWIEFVFLLRERHWLPLLCDCHRVDTAFQQSYTLVLFLFFCVFVAYASHAFILFAIGIYGEHSCLGPGKTTWFFSMLSEQSKHKFLLLFQMPRIENEELNEGRWCDDDICLFAYITLFIWNFRLSSRHRGCVRLSSEFVFIVAWVC